MVFAVNIERLNQATEFAAIVVSGSLLLGVSWLIGKCWTIGLDSFGYIMVADIARSAILISPAYVLLAAAMLIWKSAYPSRTNERSKELETVSFQRKVLRFDILMLPLMLFFGYMFLTPSRFYSLMPLWGAAIVGTSLDFVWQLRKARYVSALTQQLCIALSIAFSVALAALSFTGSTIYDFDAMPTEVICLKEHCREGTVISRFSDATYLRWDGEKQLVVIANSEISSVESKRVLTVDPLIDLRPTFWRMWQSLMRMLGC